MSTATFRAGPDFSARGPRVAAELARKLQGAAVVQIAKRANRIVDVLTPVGGIMVRDRHPGQMKRSWRSVAPGGTPATPAAIANLSPYAGIIDRGRKRGVTPIGARSRARSRGTVTLRLKSGKIRIVTRKGKRLRANPQARMLGSKQAPRGITRPAWKYVTAQANAIVAAASAAAESGAEA